jgi:hypothetical protein
MGRLVAGRGDPRVDRAAAAAVLDAYLTRIESIRVV